MDDGYFHGINKMKKPGFKVIKPPGGQTQINIFKQDQEVKPSPINPCQAERNSSHVFSHTEPQPIKSNADRNSSSIVFGGPELPPAPVTPAPVTPGPVTPAPVTPAPAAPAPAAPGPVTPAPTKPAPAVNSNTQTPNKSNKAETPKVNSNTETQVISNKVETPKDSTCKTPSSNNNDEPCTPQNDNRKNTTAQVRSSTKVIAPPGGRSSINLYG